MMKSESTEKRVGHHVVIALHPARCPRRRVVRIFRHRRWCHHRPGAALQWILGGRGVATSLLFVVGTSLSGAKKHTSLGNVSWPTGVTIGLVGAVTAQLSSRLVLAISGTYDWLLNLFYLAILSYFAVTLLKKTSKPQKPKKSSLLAALVIGMMAGLLSALLGIGGGFIIVPLLVSWLGFSTHRGSGRAWLPSCSSRSADSSVISHRCRSTT